MATVLLALAVITALLGVGLVYALTLQVVRQNGRLLLRVEALEDTLEKVAHVVSEDEVNAFLMEYPWLRLREETNDVAILREIVHLNTYRLPPAFEREDVIVDVGAHVGLFALAALARGCGEVHCFEPHPANAILARRNLAPVGERARLTQAAVWRSDTPAASLRFQASVDPENLGGGDVYQGTGIEVAAVGFDDVLLEASRSGERRVRLLKLDCEGSEYPILLTSKRLDLVDEIVGEFHAVPESVVAGWDLGPILNGDTLAACLEAAGFIVELQPDESTSNAMGMFFARRQVRQSF